MLLCISYVNRDCSLKLKSRGRREDENSTQRERGGGCVCVLQCMNRVWCCVYRVRSLKSRGRAVRTEIAQKEAAACASCLKCASITLSIVVLLYCCISRPGSDEHRALVEGYVPTHEEPEAALIAQA